MGDQERKGKILLRSNGNTKTTDSPTSMWGRWKYRLKEEGKREPWVEKGGQGNQGETFVWAVFFRQQKGFETQSSEVKRGND